jgi:queuine tRNA-ribosyltransferase accessory subunit
MVTLDTYMSIINTLQPDIYTTMVDEVPGDAKRCRAEDSVKRCTTWAKSSLLLQSSSSSIPLLPIHGAQYTDLRQKSAQDISQIISSSSSSNQCGIYIAGLGTGESSSLRSQLIQASLQPFIQKDSNLTKIGPRMVSSLSCPEDILQCISLGVDMFDGGFIEAVTAGGYALCFPLTLDEMKKNTWSMDGMKNEDNDSSDGSKLSMWGAVHMRDKKPLVKGCPCIACRNHSRAYIHHLLVTHEMTAQVLLEAHNTTHMLRFFTEIRCAIGKKKFEEYKEAFMNYKQHMLVVS